MSRSTTEGRSEIEAGLRHIGKLADADIDLAGTALLLAALDRPRVGLARYRDHLEEVCHDTAEAAARLRSDAGADQRCHILASVLAGCHGYAGDETSYEDLQNANLMRVIDRRRGLPVAIGILYIHAARSQGWPAAGLAFPGHFLVRLDGGGIRRIIDPFAGGIARETAELRDLLKALAGADAELTATHYAAVGNRDILLRLQNNVKLRHLRDGRPQDALAVLERMLLFAPQRAGLWREAGQLHAHLDNRQGAALALERFLMLARGNGADRYEAACLLQRLREQPK